MIYTVGDSRSYHMYYLQYLCGQVKTFQKAGRRTLFAQDPVPGGSVWQTFEEAKAVADQQKTPYWVFGVEADWEADTYIVGNDRHLLRDADLIWVTQEPTLVSRAIIRDQEATNG